MALTYHYHPLSSFCWKVLTALYETGTPFTPALVDLGDPEKAAAFRKLSPLGKMPVLVDDERGETVTESSIIIEYLDFHYPGPAPLIPATAALTVRALDRFFDLYVHDRMQKIVGDRIRPAGTGDAFGVAEAQRGLASAYDEIERLIGGRTWAAGNAFTMADCAAAPALWYANKVVPIGADRPETTAYLERLSARPSFARAVEEAGPYLHMFPG